MAMRRFARAVPIYWTLFIGLAIFAIGVMAIPKTLGLEINNWSVTKIQAQVPIAPPDVMVLHGASPDASAGAEHVAVLFAAAGLFDVFLAPPQEEWGVTGEKLDVENSERCRSEAKTMFSEGVKVECIHRATRGPLPGCRLQIDLNGPPISESVAQSARIYVVLEQGEPCPFYDRRFLSDDLRLNGLRPWRTIRLVAEVPSPTLQSILRAIGVEPNKIGH
jgi:hypothetical protein